MRFDLCLYAGGLAVVALASTFTSPASAAPPPAKEKGREIDLYTRKPSDKPGKNDRLASEVLNLDKIEVEHARLADVQLGKTYEFEGISLDNVLERYKKKAGKANRVLLHFANGMMIPLAVPGDGETSGVFIARAVAKDGANFEKTFPEVPKKEGLVPEPRPITFAGNKVVIEDGAHALQPASATATFSPWHYVDSLVSIELVEGKTYDRMFEIDKASEEVTRGMSAFLGRCQFCHGVREVGATYGWDFVLPSPIYQAKDAEKLTAHIKSPAKTMPAQKDAEAPEVKDLWAWLKAIADAKPRAYKP